MVFCRIILCSSLVWAEDPITRPKIALVLGGGGARGAAHVGVLKVLEEQRVPIDYIVGTSMGAIVAGLYVSGKSPEEMARIFDEIDWNGFFSDKPTDDYLPFRRKNDEQRLMNFETGYRKGKIILPRGFIAGQKLGFFLKRLTKDAAHIKDFDCLPIPFRAVATNIGSGEVYIFDHGNIADAMRASMSIPGAFSPIEVDGKILVDGGVVNNIPVDVAKKMGADIIIAVDVGPALDKPENLQSAVAIMMQALDILGSDDAKRQLALLDKDDIIVKPQVGGIAVGSFNKTPEAVTAGEQAARKIADSFAKYSISEKEYKEYLSRLRPADSDPMIVGFVEVSKPKKLSPETVKARIATHPGDSLDMRKWEKDLNRIYAMGDFEKIDYDVIEKDGQRGLYVKTKEKEWGPNYLRFGLNLNSDSTGNSEYTLLADFRMTQINSLGGEWRNTFGFGANTGIDSEFHQPLDVCNRFFIAPNFSIQRYLYDIYQEDHRIAEYRVDHNSAGINLGMNFCSYTQFKIGVKRGSIEAEPEVGGMALPEFESIQEGAFTAQILYDQFDSHIFPKHGSQAKAVLYVSDKKVGADFNYEKMELGFTRARTLSNKHTLVIAGEAGTSVDEDTPFYDQFTLGGFLSLSGYGEKQLRGMHRGLGRVIYYYTLGDDDAGIASNIHLGAAVEYGDVWNRRGDIDLDDMRLNGTVFVGMKTLLGPLYFGYGRAEGSTDGRIYLFLGQTFY